MGANTLWQMREMSLLFFLVVGFMYGGTLYEERQGGQKRIFRLEEEKTSQGIRVVATSTEETHIFWLDERYATQKWFFTNKNTQFVIEREGNILVRKERGIVVTNYTIDDAPWYQFVEVSFRPWILSGEKNRGIFWIIQPGVMALHRMVAKKEGEETLEIGGKRIPAVKVRMTLPGAASAFWGAWYWFDKSGIFLRYEGIRIVGQPKTFVERLSP